MAFSYKHYKYRFRRSKRRDRTLLGHLYNTLERLDINCVIDVGANRGQYAQEIRSMGFTGRIASFEPVPEAFTALRDASRGDPDWQVHNLALGAEQDHLPINVTNQTELSSFLKPSDSRPERFHEGGLVQKVVHVPVARIDAMFDEVVSGISTPRVLLKMDTQGYDLQVLQGAGGILSSILALQSEVSVIPLYDGMSSWTSALEKFDEYAFKVTGLYPVTREKLSRVVIEFDCVLVNVKGGD